MKIEPIHANSENKDDVYRLLPVSAMWPEIGGMVAAVGLPDRARGTRDNAGTHAGHVPAQTADMPGQGGHGSLERVPCPAVSERDSIEGRAAQ